MNFKITSTLVVRMVVMGKMAWRFGIVGYIFCTMAAVPISAQTIAEKKAGIVNGASDFDKPTQELLKRVNNDLVSKEDELRALYSRVQYLYEHKAPPADFKALRDEINAARSELTAISDAWREALDKAQKGEGYALWNQPQTTLGQLVIDYGSSEYVYVIPPEIGAVKIGVASTIPVPRAMWSEMLEMILLQNAVGVRQLNPFVRILYPLKQNQAGLELITNNREDLEYLPMNARVGFFVSPDPSEVRRVGFFLERFINPNTTTLQMVGRDMLIVSSVAEVKEVLKLYDFVSSVRGTTEYKLVPLQKVDTEEMAKVLEAMFEQFQQEQQVYSTDDKGRKSSGPPKEGHGLKVVPLKDVARAVFLVGTRDEILQAETIIREVEMQVGTAREKIVFTYRVKHSDPEELAQVIAKIYDLLVSEGVGREPARRPVTVTGPNGEEVVKVPAGEVPPPPPSAVPPQINIISQTPAGERASMYAAAFPTVVDDTPGFYQMGQVSINPTPIRYEPEPKVEINKGRNNFLVDPRSSTLVMVLDPLMLPRVKSLLRRIDIPKKMVQLDVLLIEYRNKRTNDFGLNLLSVGGCASNTRRTCFKFDDVGQLLPTAVANPVAGITSLLISRPKDDAPAFDLIYRFLMTQEDTVVNANPSVVTVNEEEAHIQIKEEISISTGIVEVFGTGNQVGPKEAFTRAQYGTDIRITPTIHTKGDEPEDLWDDGPDYVTLKTYVLFDDALPSLTVNPDRPTILRRNIENVMRVADGQTAIIGGLKRKDISDARQMIPYLGELPEVGKLFSNTQQDDKSTEMFIFITPTIIYDQCEGIEKVKRDQLFRRPGDIPCFMCALDEARYWEQQRHLQLTMEMVFGRPESRCVEYGDDACDRPRIRRPVKYGPKLFNDDSCSCKDACKSYW